jgi:hypothetical protein
MSRVQSKAKTAKEAPKSKKDKNTGKVVKAVKVVKAKNSKNREKVKKGKNLDNAVKGKNAKKVVRAKKDKTPKKSVNAKKVTKKIKNWPGYNNSLIGRGSITLWLDDSVVKNWYHTGKLQKGAQYLYSEHCITSLLSLKCYFKLPYRQTIGLARSLFHLLQIDKEVPSYTQLSRRAATLNVKIATHSTSSKLHLVIDSTGLKVYGEGEWKTRQHGYSKHRTWRKLHLLVNPETGDIEGVTLTENGVDDASQVEPLLTQAAERGVEVIKLGGDGAYDRKKCWDLLAKKGIQGIIPPQENAAYWVDENGELLDHERNKILKRIDATSRKEWKEQSGYHRRSLGETAMFRFKKILGNSLFSREIETQQTEAAIKVNVLNKLTGLGMPIYEQIKNDILNTPAS